MTRHFGVRALAVVVIFAGCTVASAQVAPSDLFFEIATNIPQATTAGSGFSRAVGMRLDRLFDSSVGPATTIRLSIDTRDWIARFERQDRDAAGFRSWVGSLDGIAHSHVVFTERNGIVSGLINAISSRYQLRTLSQGVYLLEQVQPDTLRRELDPVLRSDGSVSQSADVTAGLDDGTTIDVLLLYTIAARARAGGDAQIEAVASQIISDSNTIFARSAVVPRFRLAGSAPLPYTEAPSMETDLLRLTDSSVAQGLRNDTRADLVQLLVSSPDLNACGVGWLLTGPSANFEAYSVADVSCVGQYTPTHEMGHNMGSHHAPEDGATGTALPFSYAYKDPVRGFRTVMACPCAGVDCPRIPNFSNPSVPHDGHTTGSTNQNNALSVNMAAFTVANWRQAGVATPPAPTGLVTQVRGTFVTATWDPVHPSAGVTSYTVQVGSAPGASDLAVASGDTPSIAGHVSDGTFHWRVIAVNAAGPGPPSSDAQFTVGGPCTPPGPPRDLTFWLDGRTVNMKWSQPATGSAVTNYILEAGSRPGLADIHNSTTGRATTHESVAAPPGIYFARLRAQNECGISEPTAEQLILVR
jgi:Metallo-peptidase family M12B Reprolysin-like